MEPFHSAPTDTIDAAAALWLSRRDRGLSAAEQDEYMQWLAADARHAETLTRHAATLERMMQLYEWQPAHDTEPNPELFAPPASRFSRARRAWPIWAAGLAAAAAIVVAVMWSNSAPRTMPLLALKKTYLRVNERLVLPDSSRVELRDGSEVIVQYSDTERRVKLTGGEAHFTVWKDKARPFIVDVAGIEVRAVGTAFNVRLGDNSVEVLVTEGTVGVERTGAATKAAPVPNGIAVPAVAPMEVTIGERAVVPIPAKPVIAAATSADVVMPPPAAAPVITSVSADEIRRELAWQAPRLQFDETPLKDAIAEFNRLNRHQLELGDSALGKLGVGGTFRPDNVDAFIRLLRTTHYLEAEPAGENRTVLRRQR